MMNKLELKLVQVEDFEMIQSLAQKIWWRHYPAYISNEQIEYMLDKMYSHDALLEQQEQGQVFRLVLLDAMPIGFVSVSEKAAGRYFLHKFYLDNDLHGRGLGQQTFQLLLGTMPNLQELRLTVNRKNFPSINFYFKIGFKIEQNLEMPIGNGFVMDDFVMLFRPAVRDFQV